MNSQDQRIERVFLRARKVAGEERDALLNEAGLSPDERAELQSLLAHDEAAGGVLDRSLLDLLVRGQRVGEFEILRPLAKGGMGIIYEAQQDQPRRRVALKLLRWELLSDQARKRFEQEVTLLARLNHPFIAKVYQSGLHRSRLPYYAMEMVPQAKDVLTFARDRGLSLRQRVELIAKVADAVQHGHQHHIIHRDLKPANILCDPQGNPRVIDFGIARFVGEGDLSDTQLTLTHQFLGTASYMSPEQCSSPASELDVRTDVYSLAVVLYELLCQKLPYDVPSSSIFEAARVIRETPPARPSTLRRQVRGDLETVLLKALSKEVRQRYPSMLEFGEDLRAYLHGDPVRARPPTLGYALSRLARKNPVASMAVLIATLAVVCGVIGVTISWLRTSVAQSQLQAEYKKTAEALQVAREQRALAVREAERAQLAEQEARLSMEFMFGSYSEILQYFIDLPLADRAFTEATRKIQEFESQVPSLALKLYLQVGSALLTAGRRELGVQRIRDALRLAKEGHSTDDDHHEWVVECVLLGSLTLQEFLGSDPEKLRDLMRRLEEHLVQGETQQLLKNHDLQRLMLNRLRTNLGSCARALADFDAAIEYYELAVQDLLALVPESERNYVHDLHTAAGELGRLYLAVQRSPDAIVMFEDVLAVHELRETHNDEIHGNLKGGLASAHTFEAWATGATEGFARAKQLYEEARQHFTREWGPQHPYTLMLAANELYNLRWLHEKDPDRAPRFVQRLEQFLRTVDAVEWMPSLVGVRIHVLIGQTLGEAGRYKEAAQWYFRAKPWILEVSGPQGETYAKIVAGMALNYRKAGLHRQALEAYRESIRVHDEWTGNPQNAKSMVSRLSSSRLLILFGDYELAEQYLRSTSLFYAPDSEEWRNSQVHLAALYEVQGDYDRADHHRQLLQEAGNDREEAIEELIDWVLEQQGP